MKKILMFLPILWLALTGVVIVLAAGPGVDSNPYLFSLIKTDQSKNNNVTIAGNSLHFTPGTGMGGQMYGFQRNSTYYYHDLIRLQNNSSQPIQVWYTLDSGLAELYEGGAFWLSLDGSSDSKWNQHSLFTIAERGRTGAVGFSFHIPSDQKIMEYSGRIIFHAKIKEAEPVLPPTGKLYYFTIAGLLLFSLGLLIRQYSTL